MNTPENSIPEESRPEEERLPVFVDFERYQADGGKMSPSEYEELKGLIYDSAIMGNGASKLKQMNVDISKLDVATIMVFAKINHKFPSWDDQEKYREVGICLGK